MREVVLDTETTGLDPQDGHRIVEIGCIELVYRRPTGRHYQTYLNPEREMPESAFAVHGLSSEFLKEKPVFREVAADFLAFLGEDRLVVHNAPFDIGFLNVELERAGHPSLPLERAVDTVLLARRKFPGAPAKLDDLCKRFNIDNSRRTKHGALLDAELLSEVYLELIGARQGNLGLALAGQASTGDVFVGSVHAARTPRAHAPTAQELARHRAFVATLKNPVWNR